MRSRQLLRLQQQFLRSLHSAPTPWLLAEIEPAQGFAGHREEVLALYLKRAMARTVDPLVPMFPGCRWLFGDQVLHGLLERFYGSSPGEPISTQQLIYEFIGFLDTLSDQELQDLMIRQIDPGVSHRQAALEVAMLDARRVWSNMAQRRPSPGPAALLHLFHERRHRWGRPRLDRGTRLVLSRFDLTRLEQAVVNQEPLERLPLQPDGPSSFLLHRPPDAHQQVALLSPAESRLLGGCNGTMTVTALCHQESFFGKPEAATEAEIRRWIEAQVIVDLQTELPPGSL